MDQFYIFVSSKASHSLYSIINDNDDFKISGDNTSDGSQCWDRKMAAVREASSKLVGCCLSICDVSSFHSIVLNGNDKCHKHPQPWSSGDPKLCCNIVI